MGQTACLWYVKGSERDIMTEKVTTLLFLVRDDEILLAMKKRGFGANRYNGVGGKLDPGETVEQTLVRESEEEISVKPI